MTNPIKSEKIEGTRILTEYNSTNIESSEYDTSTSDLLIKFKAGKSYVYKKVPYPLFTKMRLSESIGKFLNREISRAYRYKEVK